MADLADADRLRFTDGRLVTERDLRQAVATPLRVHLDDEPEARLLVEHAHIAQHKPAGVVTALRDPVHPVAHSLLKDAPLFAELRAVGRLDLDTNGLLLWTTDGQLVQRLTHPKRAVPRTYEAALARPFTAPPAPLVLDDGHAPHIQHLEAIAASAAHPSLARPPDAASYARITIVGGAYHEVRRIFAALGSHVLALCRTRFGALTLPPEQPPGAWWTFDPSDV